MAESGRGPLPVESCDDDPSRPAMCLIMWRLPSFWTRRSMQIPNLRRWYLQRQNDRLQEGRNEFFAIQEAIQRRTQPVFARLPDLGRLRGNVLRAQRSVRCARRRLLHLADAYRAWGCHHLWIRLLESRLGTVTAGAIAILLCLFLGISRPFFCGCIMAGPCPGCEDWYLDMGYLRKGLPALRGPRTPPYIYGRQVTSFFPLTVGHPASSPDAFGYYGLVGD